MPLPYRQVLERYDRARAFGETKSLPEYAAHLNDIYQTDDFSEGLRDGPWTRFSTRADQNVFEPLASVTTAPLGAAVGSLFGQEDAGYRVGQGLPRALLQSAPAYLLGPETGLPATAAVLGSMGLGFGAQTYADTGSAKAALFSGATAAALPAVGKYAGELGASAFGAPLYRGSVTEAGAVAGLGRVGSPYTGLLDVTPGQRAAQFGASQVAQSVLQEGSGYAQHKTLNPDEPYNWLSADFLIGQIPFTAVDAYKMAKAPKIARGDAQSFVKPFEPKTRKVESFVPPSRTEEGQAMVDAALDAYDQTVQGVRDGTVGKDKETNDLGVLLAAYTAPKVVAQAKAVQEQVLPKPQDAIVTLQGRAEQLRDGAYRFTVETHDAPEGLMRLPEHMTVRVPAENVTVDPVTGVATYKGSVGDVDPKSMKYAIPLPRQGLDPNVNPDLPVQPPIFPNIPNDPYRQPAEQVLSDPQAGLYDRGTPVGDVFKGLTQTEKVIAKEGLGMSDETLNALTQSLPLAKNNSILTNARWHGDDSISIAFDATGKVPTPEELTALFEGQGFTVGVEQFQTNIISATQGKVKYRITGKRVDPNGMRVNSKKTAQEAYLKLFGTDKAINEKSAFQQSGSLEQRFGQAWQYGAEQQGLAKPQNNTVVLKELIHAFEPAKVKEEGARAKTQVKPESAEAWVEVTGDLTKSKATVEKELAASATHTQAAETARLLTQTPEVESSVKTQDELETGVREMEKVQATKLHYKEAEQVGFTRLEEAQKIAHYDEKSQGVLRALKDFTKDGADRKNISLILTRAIGRWDGESIDGLRAMLHDEIYNKDGTKRIDVESRGAGIPHPETGKVGMSEEEAKFTWTQLPKDQQDLYEVAKGRPGEWKVQAKVTGVNTTSLDADRGESGMNLHNKITEATPQMEGEVVTKAEHTPAVLPKVAVANMLDSMESMEVTDSNLQRRMDEVGLTREEWNQVKDDLIKDTYDGENPSHAKVFQLFNNKQRRPNIFTFGSRVPSDPEVVQRMGLERGGAGLVDWIIGLKIPVISDQAVGYTFHPDKLATLGAIFEGPGWSPLSTHYDPNTRSINLDALPTKATEVEAARIVAHEINHHFTLRGLTDTDPVSLQFQKEAGEILTALQKSPLPPKVKALLTKALKDDHYGQLLSGKIKDIRAYWEKTLGKELTKEYSGILYGLLNTHEMAAQMHSDHSFISFMEGTRVPGEKGTNALNWFAKIWSKLMGKGQENDGMVTAFEAMTKSFDDYLTGGVLRKTYNGKDYIRDILVREKGSRPEALASRMNTVDRTFTKGDLFSSIYGFEREGEGGLLPVTMTPGAVDQPLRTALVSGEAKDVFRGTMSLLPEQLPVHQDLWYRMQQDVEIARDLHTAIKDGKLQGEIPPGAEEKLKLASTKLNAMRRALKKQGVALKGYADLQNLTYEGLRHTTGEGRLRNEEPPNPLSPPPDIELGQGLMGIRPSPRTIGEVVRDTSRAAVRDQETITWAERMFSQLQFLAKLHPEVQDFANRIFGTQSGMFSRANLLTEARFTNPKTGQVDPALQDVLARVRANKKSNRAYTDMFSLIQVKVKEGATWSLNDPDFKSILKNLGKLELSDVLTMKTQDNLMHKYWVNTQVREFYGELNHLNTSKVIAARDGMLPEQAEKVSNELYEALGYMRDPMQAEAGRILMEKVASQMTPQTFLAAMKHANGSLQSFQKMYDVMKQNYDFVNESRNDRFQVVMTGPAPEYKNYNAPAKTKAEAIAIEEKQLAKGYTTREIRDARTKNSPAGGLKPEIMGVLEDMDASDAVLIEQALSDRPDLLAQLMPLAQKAERLKTATDAFSPVPMKRELVEGREYLDLLDNREQFYKRINNWMHHKLTRAHSDLALLHPEVAGNRVMKQTLEQATQNFLSPDNPIVSKINEMVFYQKLGLNLGNMAQESLQSLTTGMQALLAETGSVRDAASLLSAASKEVIQHGITGKWNTPAKAWLIRAMEIRGDKAPVLFNDMIDADSANLMSLSRGLGAPVKKGVSVVKHMVKGFSGFFQRYNNTVIQSAAFDLFLSQHPEMNSPAHWEEAYTFSRNVKLRGTFTGGKAQRSIGFYGMLGPKGVAVPQIMGSLQTYVVGWFSQMAQDFKIGFRGAGGEGLTETQRQGSRKAFLYGLAAQSVLAGGLGLPGVGQGIALLNQATGVDLKGWLRQNLAGLFDEDQNSGGLLTNLALRGAGQAFSPIDPSNRSAISVPFLGLDPYKGFSIAALAGAPGSSVQDLVQGMMAAARGDGVGLQKLLPSALKGPASLIQGEGDVRDNRGSLLQTLSPAERWMTALGLPSSRIALARDTADSLAKLQKQAQRERESQVDSLARLVRQGKTTEVQRQMLQLKQANPDLDLKALGKSIAARVVAQSVPYDAGRSLNVGLDMAGLQPQVASNEVLRRQMGYGVEQSLGLRPSFNPQADFEAGQVDSLRASNPYLGRAGALQSVRGTKPKRGQYVQPLTWGSQ